MAQTAVENFLGLSQFSRGRVFVRTFSIAMAILCMAAIVTLAGCGPRSEARNELKHRGITYSMPEFHKSVAHNDKEVVALFLAAGMDINAGRGGAGTPLMSAVNAGREEMVKYLIAQGADVNATSQDGSNPLILAALKGYDTIATFLVERGANVNVRSSAGVTPLYLAAMGGHETTINLLLAHKVDVDVADMNGWPALLIASQNGYSASWRYWCDMAPASIKNTVEIRP